eukprot:gene2539-biopygen1863
MRNGMSWLRGLALAVCVSLLSAAPGLAQSGEPEAARVGLVIGNGAYPL